jgi:O-antigen/teichoic acid export membrane protein
MQFKSLSLVNALRTMSESVVSLLAAIAGFGYWALVLGNVVGITVYTVLVLSSTRMRPSFANDRTIASITQNARRLLYGGVGTFLGQSADAVLGALVVGAEALGGYRFMFAISQTPVERLSGIQMYASASLFGNARDEEALLRKYLRYLIKATAYLVFPALIGIALTASELVNVVLGEKWAPFVSVLVVLAVYSLTLPLMGTLVQVVVARGDSQLALRNGITQLVRTMGATGLALAWFVPLPINLLRTLTASKSAIAFGWIELLSVLSRPAVATALMAVGVTLWRTYCSPSIGGEKLRLFLEVAVGATCYVPVAALLARGELATMLALVRRKPSVA